ncbi:MAG: bifunctional heptose 7-phosphate kinase/heptose 1-phosphate adenyltransferase [Alphaproteobacteria bacterium]|nr:bifunctional heptose 7-phosphate kinase/heptose 1-phosphate adenyltransferase [Alphaproteobacteria bacterium]
MADHYVSGGVARVSDEAPVPILKVRDDRWTPGGAANVAANIEALGGEAVLIGVTGDDETASHLRRSIGGLATHLLTDGQRRTTLKTRYMGGQHQMLRVDREDAHPIGPDVEERLILKTSALLPGAGALILSDYAKGVLTDRVISALIEEANRQGILVMVDPKRQEWRGYAGARLITPNRKELQLATGLSCDDDQACAEAAASASRLTGADILLTRSERGMSLFRRDHAPFHIAAEAREVFDVSGAGDTVVATLALGVAAGLDLTDAVRIANVAAGVVVGKRGTATVSRDELSRHLHLSPDQTFQNPIALGEAVRVREQWRRDGLTVGFTNGCFDIIHPGHVALIAHAAASCDRLIVALNTDASVKRLKGDSRPVQSQEARARVIDQMKGVSLVMFFDDDTPLSLIQALLPDLLIKGADYTEDQIVGADVVRNHGGQVLRVHLVEGQSTTRIIRDAGQGSP